MKTIESPDRMAAAEACENDPLGGKVDPENSLTILTAQPPRPRAGNATGELSAVPRPKHEIPRPAGFITTVMSASGIAFTPTEHPTSASPPAFARVRHCRHARSTPMNKIQKHQAVLKQNATTPAVQYDNPWLEAAAEAGSEFGKILKFAKGEWQIGEDTVPEGMEYIAYIDEVARAWIKFEDQSVTDRRVVKVATGRPPEREDLGDTDPSQWELGEDGKPRDPWVLQWLLPMSPVDTVGDLVVFATSSKGGIGAIGALCQVYGRSPRDGLLPIVALKCTSYKHPVYGKVLKPDLPIVGWHGTAPQAPSSSFPKPSSGAGGASVPLNDEIPF